MKCRGIETARVVVVGETQKRKPKKYNSFFFVYTCNRHKIDRCDGQHFSMQTTIAYFLGAR